MIDWIKFFAEHFAKSSFTENIKLLFYAIFMIIFFPMCALAALAAGIYMIVIIAGSLYAIFNGYYGY